MNDNAATPDPEPGSAGRVRATVTAKHIVYHCNNPECFQVDFALMLADEPQMSKITICAKCGLGAGIGLQEMAQSGRAMIRVDDEQLSEHVLKTLAPGAQFIPPDYGKNKNASTRTPTTQTGPRPVGDGGRGSH